MKTIKILIYGGFEKVNRELAALLVRNDVEVTFIKSTRHTLSLSSMYLYDAAFVFWTNISHASCAAFKNSAIKQSVPCRLLKSKGAASCFNEIKTSLTYHSLLAT